MADLTKMSLKEIISNLRVDIPLAGYNLVGPYWKEIDYIPDYNKFYFIEEGKGILKVDGKEYSPVTNDLFLMPAGIKQSYWTPDLQNTYLKHWVHFTAKVGDINIFDIVKTPLCVTVTDVEYLSGLFKQLFHFHMQKDSFISKAMVNSIMLQIICYFLFSIPEDKIYIANNTDMNRILPVISYIENHLNECLNIEKLSEIACLQPNYFINFFNKHMHLTPIKYVNFRKMERAVSLLQSTDMKIKEISEQSGFQNEMYFSKLFKKSFNMTPREYRKSKNTVL